MKLASTEVSGGSVARGERNISSENIVKIAKALNAAQANSLSTSLNQTGEKSSHLTRNPTVTSVNTCCPVTAREMRFPPPKPKLERLL
jgi:hypothetical protein